MDKSASEFDVPTEEKKAKIDDIKEPLEDAQTNTNVPSLSIQEQAFAKFAGVKNMLSTAVWGVPYAKVVEDPLEISVCDSELEVAAASNNVAAPEPAEVNHKSDDNPQNCIIA